MTIGGLGLTDAVLAEIARALTAHELIKVRAAAMGRRERDEALEIICGRTGALPVQHIGKVLVLYREKPREATRSARRGSRSA